MWRGGSHYSPRTSIAQGTTFSLGLAVAAVVYVLGGVALGAWQGTAHGKRRSGVPSLDSSFVFLGASVVNQFNAVCVRIVACVCV